MENETTLKDQVNALKRFEEWLHSAYQEETVKRIYRELSTIGSRKVDIYQVNILLYPLDSTEFISKIENKSFEREKVEYTIHLVPINECSRKPAALAAR